VSVVIIARNEETRLREAVDSALAQSCEPLEIIVVNDASTDGTQAVIDAYTAGHPDLGAARATGELLAFLDADDVWFPDKLAVQCALLDRYPTAGYTYGSAVEFGAGWVKDTPEHLVSPGGLYTPPDLCLGYLREGFWNFWPSGLLIKRQTFELSGGFIAALGAFAHWEDFFYACALALDETAYVHDEPLMYYRIHDASCSTQATATGKTIVDERMGLEWFIAHLGARAPRSFPQEIIPALTNRLEQNGRAFFEALVERPALAQYGDLYAPPAMDRIEHALRRLNQC
jgi:glycosyltransferase involved in cell wall biosynthesis